MNQGIVIVDAGRAATGATAIRWDAPHDYDCRIVQVQISISTSAVAGNRYWLLRVLGPSGFPDLAAIGTASAHAANTTTVHVFHAGFNGTGLVGGFQSHPMPTGGIWVPRGGQLRWSPGASNDAGDAVGPFTFSYVPLR